MHLSLFSRRVYKNVVDTAIRFNEVNLQLIAKSVSSEKKEKIRLAKKTFIKKRFYWFLKFKVKLFISFRVDLVSIKKNSFPQIKKLKTKL